MWFEYQMQQYGCYSCWHLLLLLRHQMSRRRHLRLHRRRPQARSRSSRHLAASKLSLQRRARFRLDRRRPQRRRHSRRPRDQSHRRRHNNRHVLRLQDLPLARPVLHKLHYVHIRCFSIRRCTDDTKLSSQNYM